MFHDQVFASPAAWVEMIVPESGPENKSSSTSKIWTPFTLQYDPPHQTCMTHSTIIYNVPMFGTLAKGKAAQNPGRENHVVACSLWWSWRHSVSLPSGGATAVVDPTWITHAIQQHPNNGPLKITFWPQGQTSRISGLQKLFVWRSTCWNLWKPCSTKKTHPGLRLHIWL